MAAFTWKVEAKFDGSTWTDITNWVMRVNSRRGRATDLDDAEAGMLTVVLKNSDGRFTPGNTQGAYVSGGVSQVLPGVPVRASVDGVVQFTGKAESWPPSWGPGMLPTVVLTAVDGFEDLATFELDYPNRETVQANDPDGYWPLNEDAAPFEDRSTNSRNLAEAGATWTAVDGMADGADGAVKVTGADSAFDIDPLAVVAAPSAWDGTSDLSASMLFRYDVRDNGNGAIVGLLRVASIDGSGPDWEFKVNEAGMNFHLSDGSTNDIMTTATTWTEGQIYQVGFFWDVSAKQVTFYRDGSVLGTDTTALTPAAISSPLLRVVDDHLGPTAVSVSEIAIWASDQSSLMDDLGDAPDGFPSELPGARITRVLDWAGWDASARSIDNGTTPLAAIESGDAALTACQDAAAADGGLFYISKTGDAVFQGRRGRWEDATGTEYSDTYSDSYGDVGGVTVVFDDSGTDTPYQQTDWRYDKVYLHNHVTVNSNTQGTSDGISEDTTSQSTYGIRRLTITTISNNTADNAERADWELSRRKAPHLRLERLDFLVGRDLQVDAAAALELQDLVTVKLSPGSSQDDLSVDLRLASIEHDLPNGKTWTVRVGLLEADTDQPGLYGTAVYGTDYYGY